MAASQAGRHYNPAMPLRWVILAAMTAACTPPAPEGAEDERLRDPDGGSAVADLPLPEEPIDLLTPEIRRACASVVSYWRADPGALVRTLDSAVTRPAEERSADACWVMVRLEDDGSVEPARAPFAAAGWLPLHEFDRDEPGQSVRMWQLDPVRCLVTERQHIASLADTALVTLPWFEQAVACFRRQ